VPSTPDVPETPDVPDVPADPDEPAEPDDPDNPAGPACAKVTSISRPDSTVAVMSVPDLIVAVISSAILRRPRSSSRSGHIIFKIEFPLQHRVVCATVCAYRDIEIILARFEVGCV
jgi:hypothetical protein